MQRLKQLHPLTVGVLLGTFFARLGTFITMPFFAIYLSVVLKFSPVDVGWILSISAIASLVMSFVGGTLSDRYGRRTMMLSGTFGFVLVFIGLAQVETFWAFFILSALNGIFRSIFEPSARALISDTTEEENRLFVFNIRYTCINIAAAIGPGIALLLSAGNTAITFYITAFVYFGYGVAIFILFKRSSDHGKPWREKGIVRSDGPIVKNRCRLYVCTRRYHLRGLRVQSVQLDVTPVFNDDDVIVRGNEFIRLVDYD